MLQAPPDIVPETSRILRGAIPVQSLTTDNAVAHNDYDPAVLGGTALSIAQVGDWRTDCDAFAQSFDAVLFGHFQTILGKMPWPP